jgi:hypothetical protein
MPKSMPAPVELATDSPDREESSPDLCALIHAVKRRERQFIVARLLVVELARADGEDVDVAWRKYRRALAIERISALPRGDLARADVSALVAEVVKDSGTA